MQSFHREIILSGLFILFLTDGAYSQCSYRDVVRQLNLSKRSDLVSLVQPIKDSASATQLSLDVMLYAILNVNEKDQLFVSYLWVDMIWKDDFISWNPNQFCGIKLAYIPSKALWTPDITIEEMTEQDKTPQNPYLTIKSDGTILHRRDMVVVSTCKMQIYKFPFDTQWCNLTFKSAIHDDKHLKLKQPSTAERITKWSNEMMKSQSEWEFKGMTFFSKTQDNFDVNQSMIVYTVSMKRRSVLYIVNFLLPVLLFLSLDLASFMISEHGGEKLSFKVTVLLAVTVMQLLLNEILPSSSDRIPLIAMYCIGIFGLMMLSLLETIFVMYLLEKDLAARYMLDENKRLCNDCEGKRGRVKTCCCFGDAKLVSCGSASNMSCGGTSSELLHVAKEASSNNLMEASHDSGKDLLKDLAFLLSSWKHRERPGNWSKVARIINRVFFFFYIITVTLFLSYMFYCWSSEDNM